MHWIVIVAGVWLAASLACAAWWWVEIRRTIGARCNCLRYELAPGEAMWSPTMLHTAELCAPHRELIR